MTRRGITLVELLVVLVVLGVMGGMSVLAVGRLQRPLEPAHIAGWRHARAAAIRTGHSVSVAGDSGTAVRFLPDGRVLGDGLDQFTGAPLDARQ